MWKFIFIVLLVDVVASLVSSSSLSSSSICYCSAPLSSVWSSVCTQSQRVLYVGLPFERCTHTVGLFSSELSRCCKHFVPFFHNFCCATCKVGETMCATCLFLQKFIAIGCACRTIHPNALEIKHFGWNCIVASSYSQHVWSVGTKVLQQSKQLCDISLLGILRILISIRKEIDNFVRKISNLLWCRWGGFDFLEWLSRGMLVETGWNGGNSRE